MSSDLKVVTVPDKVLKCKAKPVERIDEEIRSLIEDMRQTMHRHNGIGLAAPQVGRSIQLAVVEAKKNDRPDSDSNVEIPFTVLINPKIISASSNRVSDFEGCLSIPGVEVKVERPEMISIQFQDESGDNKNLKVNGLFSRIVQHEIDHLNGILITDHGPAEKIKPS